MKPLVKIVFLSLLLLMTINLVAFKTNRDPIEENILCHFVDPKTQELQLFWKNELGMRFKSIQNLKSHLESKGLSLTFAMNGGMFNKDFSPQGLFIQNNKRITPLDTSAGEGNFYLKPNGVFYITIDNVPSISTTDNFVDSGRVKFATQSGPMLVVDGKIHPAFKEGSTNWNIRNGVGVLPNNKAVFAMSKTEINFYDFAKYFQELGCKNALYLDGYVSRMYLPEKNWIQTDGNFGVMVGVTEPIIKKSTKHDKKK